LTIFSFGARFISTFQNVDLSTKKEREGERERERERKKWEDLKYSLILI
jgi:hypothetical protein